MISRKLKEIKLLMEYAVPAEDRQQAIALLEEFSGDRIALNLFHAFYSFLPEGLDDAINGLQIIALKQGIFLLCATTGIDNYLYVVSQQQAEFLGSASNGIWDSEVLEFFGYATREESIRGLEDITRFPAYSPANVEPISARSARRQTENFTPWAARWKSAPGAAVSSPTAPAALPLPEKTG